MSTFGISSRYATALIELAEGKEKFNRISEDMEFVLNTLAQSRDLKNILKSPVIREEKKISIVEEIFSKHLDPDSLNFLVFIIRKGRENILHEILIRYMDLRNERMGIVEIDVASTVKFEEDQRRRIELSIERHTSKKVLAKYLEDENLIGGFTVRIKDQIIDASVSNQLRLLRKKLTQ